MRLGKKHQLLMFFASKILAAFLSQPINAGGILKGKFVGQVRTNFQGGPRESELSSSSKKTLFEAMEMIAAVLVPEENDKKLDLQFNGTRWGGKTAYGKTVAFIP